MKKMLIYITEDQEKKLKEKSEKTGAPVAWIVRDALDKYFQTHEKLRS